MWASNIVRLIDSSNVIDSPYIYDTCEAKGVKWAISVKIAQGPGVWKVLEVWNTLHCMNSSSWHLYMLSPLSTVEYILKFHLVALLLLIESFLCDDKRDPILFY